MVDVFRIIILNSQVEIRCLLPVLESVFSLSRTFGGALLVDLGVFCGHDMGLKSRRRWLVTGRRRSG